METVPHTKSAFKNIRKTKKQTGQNRRIKEMVKELRKKVLRSKSKKDFGLLQKALDKAKKKGVIPKNTVERIKKRTWVKISSKSKT